MNKIEKLLEESIGKWCSLRYVLPNGDVESIWGVLKEVDKDYIKLEGFVSHYLNRKMLTVVEVSFRV